MLVSKAVEGVAAAEPVSEPCVAFTSQSYNTWLTNGLYMWGYVLCPGARGGPRCSDCSVSTPPKRCLLWVSVVAKPVLYSEHSVVVSLDPRIMKSRKVMQHHDLVHEVTTQVL
jgi:hypothetical protein